MEDNPQACLDQMLSGAQQCDHLAGDDVGKLSGATALAAWWDDEGGYGPEHDATPLVEIADVFGVFVESEDSTGHGCQCNAFVQWYDTLDEAISQGLSEDHRNEYLRSLQSPV